VLACLADRHSPPPLGGGSPGRTESAGQFIDGIGAVFLGHHPGRRTLENRQLRLPYPARFGLRPGTPLAPISDDRQPACRTNANGGFHCRSVHHLAREVRKASIFGVGAAAPNSSDRG